MNKSAQIEKNEILTDLALRTGKHRARWTKARKDAFCEVVARSSTLGKSIVDHVDSVIAAAIEEHKAGRLPPYEAWALGLMDMPPQGHTIDSKGFKADRAPETGQTPVKAVERA